MTTAHDPRLILAGAAEALAGELDLDEVLQTIVETGRQLIGARYAPPGVIGEGEFLERYVHVPVPAGQPPVALKCW